MNQRWSDEELDRGLRDLFSQVRQPVAPSALRTYPRRVVARPRPRSFEGLVQPPRIWAAVTVTLAIALAVGSAALVIKPGAQTDVQVNTSPGLSHNPSASVLTSLPNRASAGGFVWT